MISSPSNPRVKYVKRLQSDRRFRRREAMFVAEGTRWLRDALAVETMPSVVLYTEQWLGRHNKSAEHLNQLTCPTIPVSDAVMRIMSDVESPPGVLCVLPIPALPLPDQPTFLLILDAIQTPGNLGTLLRTAAAAGVDGVVLAPGCVDATNPKVVRGAMGAQLRLPVAALGWDAIEALCEGTTVYVADASGKLTYTSADWTQRSALIVGNEANGPCERAKTLATAISIPMAAQTESLNAAMAGGVILFEAARQRH